MNYEKSIYAYSKILTTQTVTASTSNLTAGTEIRGAWAIRSEFCNNSAMRRPISALTTFSPH
jgi:hypothetical protein